MRKAAESFTHNDSGNLTHDAAFTYQYDAANRLKTIVFPDNYRKEFTYHYQSRRAMEVMKDASSSIVYRSIYISFKFW